MIRIIEVISSTARKVCEREQLTRALVLGEDMDGYVNSTAQIVLPHNVVRIVKDNRILTLVGTWDEAVEFYDDETRQRNRNEASLPQADLSSEILTLPQILFSLISIDGRIFHWDESILNEPPGFTIHGYVKSLQDYYGEKNPLIYNPSFERASIGEATMLSDQ